MQDQSEKQTAEVVDADGWFHSGAMTPEAPTLITQRKPAALQDTCRLSASSAVHSLLAICDMRFVYMQGVALH